MGLGGRGKAQEGIKKRERPTEPEMFMSEDDNGTVSVYLVLAMYYNVAGCFTGFVSNPQKHSKSFCKVSRFYHSSFAYEAAEALRG